MLLAPATGLSPLSTLQGAGRHKHGHTQRHRQGVRELRVQGWRRRGKGGRQLPGGWSLKEFGCLSFSNRVIPHPVQHHHQQPLHNAIGLPLHHARWFASGVKQTVAPKGDDQGHQLVGCKAEPPAIAVVHCVHGRGRASGCTALHWWWLLPGCGALLFCQVN